MDEKTMYHEEVPSDGPKDIEAKDAAYTTQGLQRKLKARHIQMIAVGSNIGTGLFVGSGKALHTGGPFSLVFSYLLISAAITIMMQCLGEMATVIPVSGSFTRYATRFLDPSIGFAMGWQYWLAWVSVFGAEASAFLILIEYWNPPENLAPLWITIFVLVNLAIHVSPVRVFGEVEVIVSAIKVVAVIMFIIITWCIMGGAGPRGMTHGGEYWTLPGLNGGIHSGFKGLGSVFVLAAFAIGGLEMIGVVSGETQHPRWNLPRAIKTLMFRIVLFYCLSMLFLSFVVPYTDPELVGGSDANSSPFVIAIKNAGIQVLPDILNAVVMVCVCSVASVSIYIGSRVLKSMAEDGFAPHFFHRTDSRGRPYFALMFTGAIGIVLAYMNLSSTGAVVFGWFSAISGLGFFLAWLVIIASNWRFHAALKAQGDDTLNRRFAYRAVLWPWLSIFAFTAIVFMIVCQFVVALFPIGGSPSASNFFSNFLSIPVFIGCWVFHKAWYRPKWPKLTEIDLITGRREEDPEEIEKLEHYERLSPRGKFVSYLKMG